MKTGCYLVALIWASLLLFPACHPDEGPIGDDDDATEVADDQPGPLHQTTWRGSVYQSYPDVLEAHVMLYLSVNSDLNGVLEGGMYHLGGTLILYGNEIPEGSAVPMYGTREDDGHFALEGGYEGYSLTFGGEYLEVGEPYLDGDLVLEEGEVSVPIIMLPHDHYIPPASRPSVP